MDMVSNCISEKAHSGDGHNGRNHLFLSIDILGCVRSVLDIVVPVVRYTAPDLAKDYFRDTSSNMTSKQMLFHLAL